MNELLPKDRTGKPIDHEKFFFAWCGFMLLCCLAMEAFN